MQRRGCEETPEQRRHRILEKWRFRKWLNKQEKLYCVQFIEGEGKHYFIWYIGTHYTHPITEEIYKRAVEKGALTQKEYWERRERKKQ